MADEQVRIDVTADDHASKVLDKVADKAEALEDIKPEIPVEADTKAAERDVTDLLAKVDKLADQPAAILLSTNAAAIAGDITKLVGQLDKLDAADPQVDVTVAQLNALQGDLDQVEAKLKSIGATEVSPKVDTTHARKEAEDLGVSAESAANVTANAMGNVAGELAGVAGATGTANMAIGQMGEYFTEALQNSDGLVNSLKNFGKQGALIGGVTALVGLFVNELNKSKRAAEQNEEQVTDLFHTLQDGGRIVDAFTAKIRDTGKLEFTGLGDVLPDLNAVGLKVDEFTRLAEQPRAKIDEWAAAQRKLVKEGTPEYDRMRDVVFAVVTAHNQAGEAEQRRAATVQALGDDTARYNDMLADQARKLAASEAATQLQTDAQQRSADMLDRVNQKLLDQAAALEDQAGAATTAADAQLSENDALGRFGEVLGDAQAKTNDVRDAAIDLAKAHQATAEAQAKARGETITATAKIDAQNDALLTTAASAKGEARNAILQYIGSVNQIPPEKLTEILALLDQGRLDEAKRKINEASVPRTVAVTADANTAAAEAELGPNGLTRPRTVEITARVRAPAFPGSGQANAPMPSAAWVPAETAPAVTNVTVNMPRGTRPDDVMGAADRYARRNGRSRAFRR